MSCLRVQAVLQHRLTIVTAAEQLQLCERQVSRLVRRYEAAGPAGLVSAQRGSVHRWLPDQQGQAMPCGRDGHCGDYQINTALTHDS
jgi:hypothetical protein